MVDAGGYSRWLAEMVRALRGGGEADVPCGSCTACCRSAQFVHIDPDETETLAAIPPELLFPAPRMPNGHVLLGYDERGHCPMLGDTGCSIYQHRPRACRVYDCRVFAATGIEPDDQPLVRERVREWRFSDGRAAESTAVRAAAAYLDENRAVLGDAAAANNAAQRAVLAIEIHEMFLSGPPQEESVRAEVTRLLGAERPA